MFLCILSRIDVKNILSWGAWQKIGSEKQVLNYIWFKAKVIKENAKISRATTELFIEDAVDVVMGGSVGCTRML